MLQVLATFFTFVTLKVWLPAPELVPELALEPAVLEPAPALEDDPLMRTSCPTCLLNSELSPCSCQIMPEESVRV